jgi:hypothetical protein
MLAKQAPYNCANRKECIIILGKKVKYISLEHVGRPIPLCSVLLAAPALAQVAVTLTAFVAAA